MQKKFKLILLLAVVCFQHCKKNNLPDQPNSGNYQITTLQDSAKVWLSKKKFQMANAKFIETLQQNISWDSSNVITDADHEQSIL